MSITTGIESLDVQLAEWSQKQFSHFNISVGMENEIGYSGHKISSTFSESWRHLLEKVKGCYEVRKIRKNLALDKIYRNETTKRLDQNTEFLSEHDISEYSNLEMMRDYEFLTWQHGSLVFKISANMTMIKDQKYQNEMQKAKVILLSESIKEEATKTSLMSTLEKIYASRVRMVNKLKDEMILWLVPTANYCNISNAQANNLHKVEHFEFYDIRAGSTYFVFASRPLK